jgi:hypothetical protein
MFNPVTDIYTGALSMMDLCHFETHEGHAFLATYNFFIAAGDSDNFIMRCPADKVSHVCMVECQVDSALLVGHYQDPTVLAPDWGTLHFQANRNRTSLIVSAAEFYFGSTITANGTALGAMYLPANSRFNARREENEFIYPQSADIMWLLDNSAGAGDCNGYLYVTWYEVEP